MHLFLDYSPYSSYIYSVNVQSYIGNPFMRDIRTEIDEINEIVPFPAVITEILTALSKDDVSTGKITRLIEADPALTANILRAANAPYYGIRGYVKNVTSAIALVGLDETSRLLLAYHMKQRLIFLNMQQWGNLESLWKHSISTAALARVIASRFKFKTGEKEFTAGLLHDMGKLVLIQYFPDSLSVTRSMIKELGMRDVEAERQTLAISHTEIGGHLGTKWAIPPEFVEVMQSHHEAAEATVDPVLTAVVRFADLLCEQWGHGINEQPEGFSIEDDACWNILKAAEPSFGQRAPGEVGQELIGDFEKSKGLIQLLA
ncbi:MAG TPA: HDOD domain-containing protein [Bacteroidota bacterium]|nr:HDOD domain-containing protein [Bacteroidota bacterium]